MVSKPGHPSAYNAGPRQTAATNSFSVPEQTQDLVMDSRGSLQEQGSTLIPQRMSLALANHAAGEAATVNGQLAQPLSNAISVAGATLTPGAPRIVSSATPISVDATALFVGSSSVPIVLPLPPLVLGKVTSLNSQAVQPLSNGVSIAGITLTPGAPPITVANTPISVGPTALFVGSGARPFAPPDPSWIPGQVATINDQVIQRLSNGVSVTGATLALAVPAITLSGPAIARGSSDLIEGTNPILPATEIPEQLVTGVARSIVSVGTSNLAFGSSTYTLPAATGPEPVALSTFAPLSVGGQAAQYDPGPAGGVLIGDQTIAQGSQANISGMVVSVGASNLNIDGSTYALPVPTAAVISVRSGNMMVGDSVHALPVDPDVIPLEVPVPVSIDGQVVQQASDGGIVVAGSRLKPGDMGVIISGTLISFDSVSDLMLGSKTIPLETSAGGSDGLIMGGFGPKSSYTTGLKGGPRNGTTISVLAIEGKAKALQGFTTWELLVLPIFVSTVLLHK